MTAIFCLHSFVLIYPHLPCVLCPSDYSNRATIESNSVVDLEIQFIGVFTWTKQLTGHHYIPRKVWQSVLSIQHGGFDLRQAIDVDGGFGVVLVEKMKSVKKRGRKNEKPYLVKHDDTWFDPRLNADE
ncbi:hypothetical protein F5880DRAFT_149081 [Lentinula raphanica]|nr:hypothetical protein F5880DRAFT_149081 [Lentinula raphanica]